MRIRNFYKILKCKTDPEETKKMNVSINFNDSEMLNKK